MALFRKFFYRKPPDGLLEISERVYVFDCCFTTDVPREEAYKVYISGIVTQLQDHFPDASFMVFNFREGECPSQISTILADYELTVMDYPRQYEGCPLLTMEMIHHFLRSGESWLSMGQQNVLLMHCEQGGWPVLAFMLAALLVYRKQYPGEQRTLDMIYKQAPRELLHLLSPLNPLPSQMRYLHYISRRNVGLEWPPLDRALTLDCVILRFIPNFDGMGGCRPIFRIYGPDPFISMDRTPKILFSTPNKSIRFYKQEDCELVKIDIHCYIQGDVVLECISLDDELVREEMMFRVMFNTAFIRSNILMLDRDSVDILWDAKERFPNDFRFEVLLSEMDAGISLTSEDLPCGEDKGGLPMEAFDKVKEMFNLDWLDLKPDAAKVLQQLASSKSFHLDLDSPLKADYDAVLEELSPRVLEREYSHRPGRLLSSASKKLFSSPSPPQSRVITPRIHVSRSTSNFSSKSLPPSAHAAVSRYHSAPSALGIMALLDDHTVSETFEDTRGAKSVSSVGTSSDSISSISLKLPQPMPPQPLSLDSASYTNEDELKPSHSLPHTSPGPPPLPPPTKEASLAPPPPPPLSRSSKVTSSATLHLPPPPPPPPLPGSALAKETPLELPLFPPTQALSSLSPAAAAPPPPPFPSTAKTYVDTVHTKKLSTVPSATKKLSTVLKHTFLPSQTSRVNSASVPPPLTLPKRTLSAPDSASSLVIPSPPTPPSMTSLSCHTDLLSSKKVTGTVGVPPPPPPPCPAPAAVASAPLPPLPPCPAPEASPSAPPPRTTPPSPAPAAAPSAPPPPPPLASPAHAAASSAPPPPPPPPASPAPAGSPSAPPPPPPPASPAPAGSPSAPPPPPTPPPASPAPAGSPSAPPPPPTPPPASPAPAGSPSAPPPPPLPSSPAPAGSPSAPPPPPPPASHSPAASPSAPPPPVPPCTSRSPNASSPGGKGPSGEVIPPPPPGGMNAPAKGKLLRKNNIQLGKKSNLKPLHWVKVTRAVKGSLWAEEENNDEFSKAPEFDMTELETLFSAAAPDHRRSSSKGRSTGPKSEKVHLIDLRRANNCEIMLTKVKMPLNDLMSSVLALDDSILDGDQVDNLIKFCPTKEEMELLKGFSGDKENLGKCEQYFLEMMKIPRVESKLRVFSFKIQFNCQVTDLRNNLKVVKSSAEEIRSSVKLKRIMQTILSLGNALNQGTARGAAVGFRLDSLLKLTDTRARNTKMTLMHYLCKVLAEKLPELLDFPKDLVSLEVAAKMQLKCLAEEMQAISKGLEKVEQELTASENDGDISNVFCKTLRDFLVGAEAEVRSLTSLYSNVGKNADALALYFGEDPARCPFEQVVTTLANFVRMFVRAHGENCKALELEKKKALKEAEAKPKK